MTDPDFPDFFGDGNFGRPGSFEEMLALIQQSVDDHNLSFQDAVKIIHDLINPGNSDHSHDVRPIFMGAITAYGYKHISDKIGSMFLNTMPWGIGFSIAVEKDFSFKALTDDEQQAILKSLCVVLLAGGLEAHIEGNQIHVTGPEGQSTSVSMDEIVEQFRTQIDEQLGPDGPEDPMGRWLP